MSPSRTGPALPASLPEHWFHILLALADRKLHGLGILEEIANRTAGEVQLWPGMLYVALRKMTDVGLVAETEAPSRFSPGGGRPRFYRITALGKRACAEEAARLARLVDVAREKRVLQEPT